LAQKTFGGWTGKTLRVNLTTGKITTEDTIGRYKDVFGGGTGIGYKVLWDEVPPKTRCFDEGNKIVLAPGPLSGTSAPTSGRTSVTCLFPPAYPYDLVATGHMGGHWGAELKYAGWDAVIIEGKSAKPVYLAIADSKVEIRDASHLWGSGIYHTTSSICQAMGPETQVAAIGQAGENLVRMAVLNNSLSHSAGGVGGVFGSKKLKAIAVKGTGAVRIAAPRAEWKKLHQYVISLMGANNQGVVPLVPQPWAEFTSNRVRWNARKGFFWGAANPPVETGECNPEDLNSIGLRNNLGVHFLGPLMEKFTVRTAGCSSCPIRCHFAVDLPQVEQFGVSRFAATTCQRANSANFFQGSGGRQSAVGNQMAILGLHLLDDYGIWTHYTQMQRDFSWAYTHGVFKASLSANEYKSIPWDLYDRNDPAFLIDLYRRIAYKEGQLGMAFGEGPGRTAEILNFPKEYFSDSSTSYWRMGAPQHHGASENAQTGALINFIYNRDAGCHSCSNFTLSGLPDAVMVRIADKLWGKGSVDPSRNFTPMNPNKAHWAIWGMLRKETHDSLTLCNYTWPMSCSPLKSRNYEGDLTIEAQLYSLATGDTKNEAELDEMAMRVFNLHRALTIRDMGTMEMRTQHDTMPDYAFGPTGEARAPAQRPARDGGPAPESAGPGGRAAAPGGARGAEGPAFTPGSSRMDRADMEVAKDIFYEQLGWDRKTGAPTRAALEKSGLKDVADGLAKLQLLPA
jgi:aldehyde:ferredoxin oxidoreductase